MIIPGFILYAVLSLTTIPQKIHKISITRERNVCLAYDRWQADFERFKYAAIHDHLSYLSWKDFLKIQEGSTIAEIETICNDKSKVNRK